MNLQKTKPGNRIERMKTAAKAFATAALLTTNIFGCDAGTSKATNQTPAPLQSASEAAKNKFLEVDCRPCPDCTVPKGASLLREGAIIGTTKQVPNVLVLRGIDYSTIEARYEKITASIPRSETEKFNIGPGELCKVDISGTEFYTVYKPDNLMAEPGWVYQSSKRERPDRN